VCPCLGLGWAPLSVRVTDVWSAECTDERVALAPGNGLTMLPHAACSHAAGMTNVMHAKVMTLVDATAAVAWKLSSLNLRPPLRTSSNQSRRLNEDGRADNAGLTRRSSFRAREGGWTRWSRA
jgi:hypothetical protein